MMHASNCPSMKTGSAFLQAYTKVSNPPASERYQNAMGMVLRLRRSLTC